MAVGEHAEGGAQSSRGRGRTIGGQLCFTEQGVAFDETAANPRGIDRLCNERRQRILEFMAGEFRLACL